MPKYHTCAKDSLCTLLVFTISTLIRDFKILELKREVFDIMEKRRLSTRNRGEPPLKKRALTPLITPRAPPPPPTPPQPTEPMEEGLPFRVKDPRLLPTLPEPQDSDLSTQEYQTISERSALTIPLRLSDIDHLQWCFGSVYRTVTAEMG